MTHAVNLHNGAVLKTHEEKVEVVWVGEAVDHVGQTAEVCNNLDRDVAFGVQVRPKIYVAVEVFVAEIVLCLLSHCHHVVIHV